MYLKHNKYIASNTEVVLIFSDESKWNSKMSENF